MLTTVDRETLVTVRVPRSYEQPLQWVPPISEHDRGERALRRRDRRPAASAELGTDSGPRRLHRRGRADRTAQCRPVPRRRAVRISRLTSFGYSRPEAAHIRGNIDVGVKPGIVLISLR